MKLPDSRVALLLSLGLLISCGGRPDTASTELDPSSEADPLKTSVVDAASDTNCGSLKPLLATLPAATSMEGLAETSRGCDVPGAAAFVRYGEPGSDEAGYTFTVKVLDGASPYAVSSVNVDDASADVRSFTQQTISSSGELFKSSLKFCADNARSSLLEEERRPVITTINGVTVCVRDEMDPNRDIWYAQGERGGLGFEIVLRGGRAEALAMTETAKGNLGPMFAQFRLGVP